MTLRLSPPAALVGLAVFAFSSALGLAFGDQGGREFGRYILLDSTSLLFSVLINSLFLGVSLHNWTRVRAEPEALELRWGHTALATAFLLAVNLAVFSNQFVLTWAALELSTMAAAPLVAGRGADSGRLASWRYFLFSTVGLGLALLGLQCIGRGLEAQGAPDGLFVDELLRQNHGGNAWISLGLALALLGYCTKLGLAPMYTWLPEAYSEAPPPVTSLLAAIQFNGALVALLRVLQVFREGNETIVSGELLALGLASITIATASLIASRRLRRILAYASIVHAGVIATGLAVGGGAAFGVLLYAVSNAFIKAMLFLTAGKLERQYGTANTDEIRGVIKGLPYSGLFLMVGAFALLGFPPFGSFVGELLILSGMVRAGFLFTFAAVGFLVTVGFVATGRTVFPMIWGLPTRSVDVVPQTFLAFVPKLTFLAALVVLGLYLPAPLNALFRDVAVSLGGD